MEWRRTSFVSRPDDLGAQGLGIAEGNQNAAAVSQQLLGVPVGRRYDGLSQPEAVGERAGRHLGFVQVGRHIDVAHGDEVEQRGLVHELIEEDDMIADAEVLHARRQALAIGLALMPHEIGMGRAQDDIDGVRAGFDDPRHGIEHDLDALVGRQKTERQDHRLSGEAEFCLGVMRFEKRDVGDAVRDDLDLARRHVMHRAQELVAFLRHDDELGRRVDDLAHHVVLGGRRLREHGVKGGHDRHFQARQQLDDIAARLATENPVLVLEARDVVARVVQELGRAARSRRSRRREPGSARRGDSHSCRPGSVMATTQVSRSGRAVATARCRSCVKVAIPQRRGR